LLIDGAAVTPSDKAEAMSSSASAMTAINFPDCTVSPSRTSSFLRTPGAKASRSMTALSVSISAITSPACTGSPSRFFQASNTPSSIVSVNFGMTTRLAMDPPPGCGPSPYTGSNQTATVSHAAPQTDLTAATTRGTSGMAASSSGRL
jgi:hypothetical protein